MVYSADRVGERHVQRQLIAERYRLLHTVGSGGMGRVWLARDEMLRRDVAVKEVQPPEWMTEAERAELGQRTLREARTAAALSHPNVVQIYDVVYAEGSPWIVMEYVRSRSLHQVVETDGPLPPERVAEIGLKVLDALVAAHRAGVLHRDVKPHNVLIADDGRVVLTDFGLATFDGDSAVTRQGMVMGSPQYVSPERARDGASTPEADMWSLGATLYAAVEGRSPFARPTTLATLTALATSPPDPPQRAGPLRPVLSGLLRKEPRQRFTAPEVDRLLHRVLDPNVKVRPRLLPRPRRSADNGPPPGAGPTVVLGADGKPRSATPVSAGGRGGFRPGRTGRRRAAIVGGVALVLVSAIGTAWAVNRDDGRDPSSPGAGTGTAGASAGATPSSGPVVMAGLLPCGEMANQVTATVTRGPVPAGEGYDLLPFWTWWTDPGEGFRIAAPVTWREYQDGDTACFHESGSNRTLSVEPLEQQVKDPLRYWKDEEARIKKGSLVAGYELERMTPTKLYQGGADWEYRYLDEGRPMQVMRILQNIGGRSFVTSWSASELDWRANSSHLSVLRFSLRTL
jgi:tRNA A-37 threonylcarbamoyl transferase component Bud32